MKHIVNQTNYHNMLHSVNCQLRKFFRLLRPSWDVFCWLNDRHLVTSYPVILEIPHIISEQHCHRVRVRVNTADMRLHLGGETADMVENKYWFSIIGYTVLLVSCIKSDPTLEKKKSISFSCSSGQRAAYSELENNLKR